MFVKILTAIAQAKSHVALRNELDSVKRELDSLRSKLELDDGFVAQFRRDRQSAEYLRAYEDDMPLVSVCVATYNRGQLLIDRCLRSICEQDYENLEIVVVGDCCTDETPDLVNRLNDSRIRFVNLAERGDYPDEPVRRWMVAGTAAVNHALRMSTGAFITHLDDDDEYTPGRIGKLVNFARYRKADLVWHPFLWEIRKGIWVENKSDKFMKGHVTTSSIFYHNWFKNIPWDASAHEYYEPGDWNRLRKIWHMGANLARYPECLLRHYKERSQASR